MSDTGDRDRLSFWGWGYADRFPDDAGRRNLVRLLAGILPGRDFALAPIPTLDGLDLPTPRVAIPDELAGFSCDSPHARASHTYGKNYRDLVRGLAGDFAVAPDFVACPGTEDEVTATLAWCAGRGVACIPFGGGTSVVGGVEGAVGDRYPGVVSLDMRGLDRVLEVDATSRAARIQAGATGPAIAAALAEHGLGLRHYPQSFEHSTLGGWIATRAGGHFATNHTHIDDFVESVRMITGAGLYQSRRLPGSGAGPSPDRLVIGSEGILGIITEAWMRVHQRPRWRSSASVVFSDFDAAVQATRIIAQSGLYPANCRLLDAREAMLHQVAPRHPGKSVLLLGFESSHVPVSWPMAQALDIARGAGGEAGAVTEREEAREADRAATGDDRRSRPAARSAESETWRRAFLDAPYRFAALASVGAVVDTFETACTWDRFDALHRTVIARVRQAMKSECGGGLISCRFTHVYPDGPAPYYTFIAAGRPAAPGPDWARSRLAQWHAIKSAASDALMECGGTITHHHAVGRLHRPWYDRQRPEPFARALLAAKSALDPSGVLNPGVLIDC